MSNFSDQKNLLTNGAEHWHYCDLKSRESGQTVVNSISHVEFSAIRFSIFSPLITLFFIHITSVITIEYSFVMRSVCSLAGKKDSMWGFFVYSNHIQGT